MKICPICHGNGFVARESNKVLDRSDKKGELDRVSFSTIVKDCDHCMNSGEISD
jgi:DnaJ-class molecular chaperone